MLKAELEVKVKELEKAKEDDVKSASQGIDVLYPKSYGDIMVEDYNRVLALLRAIAGITEPKEGE